VSSQKIIMRRYSEKVFGKLCKRCGYSFGSHGSCDANCPRKKEQKGDRFTKFHFVEFKKKKDVRK
jgi:hypothetical protein